MPQHGENTGTNESLLYIFGEYGLDFEHVINSVSPHPPNQVLIMSSKTLIQPSTSVCALLEHVITSH